MAKHTFYPWYIWSFSLEKHRLESKLERRGFDKEQTRQEMSYEESNKSMKGARSEVGELQADAVNWWLWICMLSFLWIIKHSAVMLLPNQHIMDLMAMETFNTDLPLRHQTFCIKKSHQNNVTLDTRSSLGVRVRMSGSGHFSCKHVLTRQEQGCGKVSQKERGDVSEQH